MSIEWATKSQLEKPESSPGFTLWKLTNRWQREIRAALAPVGITHVQFILLNRLAWLEDHQPNEISQKTLADQAGTDPMMTSQVVRVLIEAGYIERTPHPTDRRAFSLKLTSTGRDVVAVSVPLMEQADRNFFEVHFEELTTLASAHLL